MAVLGQRVAENETSILKLNCIAAFCLIIENSVHTYMTKEMSTVRYILRQKYFSPYQQQLKNQLISLSDNFTPTLQLWDSQLIINDIMTLVPAVWITIEATYTSTQ